MDSTAIEEKIYTIEEYLALEEHAVDKHEFYNGKIVKMSGRTSLHSALIANVMFAIKLALRQATKGCTVMDSNIKIQIDAFNHFVYPDAVVVCEKIQHYKNRKDVIVNPLLIVEVLSQSTKKYDRGEKFTEYRTLPSFKEYVLVEQTFPSVTTFYREAEDLWRTTDYRSIEDSIPLHSLNVAIAMKDMYEGADVFEDFSLEPPFKRKK